MRPKILMIHGGGTTPDIFRIQARKLDAALSQFFDLHYVTAPIECPAGPGVLPFFAGMDPFLKWMHDQPPDLEDLDTFPALDDMLQVFHTEGPFDGIVAFSQGAKATLHLLRHLERERGGDRAVDFVITVCPTCPFQGIKDPKDRRSPYAKACLELGKVQAESIHVLASGDPYNYESESMIEFFEPSARKVFRIEGGHHMPMDDGFNRKLAAMAARIYNGI